MAKDYVEAAVKDVVTELLQQWDEQNGQRKVPLGEAMERLGVKLMQ